MCQEAPFYNGEISFIIFLWKGKGETLMFSLVSLYQDLIEIVNALQQLNHYVDQDGSVPWVEDEPRSSTPQ